MLKGCWGVGEGERHDAVLVQAVARAEGSLPLVSFSNANLVVGITEVDLGEVAGLRKTIEELCDEGMRLAVLDRDLVESSVVDTKVKRAILLLDEQDGSCGWGWDRRMNPLARCSLMYSRRTWSSLGDRA